MKSLGRRYDRPLGAARASLVTMLAGVAILVGISWVAVSRSHEMQTRYVKLHDQLPKLERSSEYVSSNRCQSCHPGEHASWHASFHRTMTQVASEDSVLGRFDGTTIESQGLKYRVFRKGEEFWVEMPDPDLLMYYVQGGKQVDQFHYLIKRAKNAPVERVDLREIPRVERQVIMTTGSHHYQTYWVRGDSKFGNLLQTVPLVYLRRDEQWIPREEAFMYPPDSTRLVTQWNHHCIRCHSTGGSPGLDPKSGEFATEVGELGISCEACHGPGEEHIRANRDPIRRYKLHWANEGDATIENPKRMDHRRSSQVCGQCHGVYINRDEYAMKYAFEGIQYRPGDDIHKYRYYINHPKRDDSAIRRADQQLNPEFFQHRWWPDGTVLAGGREFTAMSVSGCYLRGEMSCLSCHSMHDSDPADQMRKDLAGNQMCTQCHRETQYTTALADHTHHASESAGSECINCHMPNTAYALFGAIRNHGILIPRVQSSAGLGVPNACNLCHLDRTLAWTHEAMERWYGPEDVYLTTDQKEVAAGLLWLLKGDAAQRAISAWHFGWEPAQQASGRDWMVPFVAQLLDDPYGVVRYIGAESLRGLPGVELKDFDFLADDERRRSIQQRVVDAWKAKPSQQRGSELLIAPNGDLEIGRLESLLRERDNRPVTIKE